MSRTNQNPNQARFINRAESRVNTNAHADALREKWWIRDPAKYANPRFGWITLAAFAFVFLLPVMGYAGEPDAFTKALEKGPLFAGLAAFVGGLGVSLTPCVYPMIAITVSVFGAREAQSRRKGMLLSTCFVLGIVTLFTPMVVGAALTGSLFGAVLSNKFVVLAIALVFIALAASMFGAFEMVLPSGVMQRLSSVGGIGYGGAFLLGLVSGLVAAPCTGPVLTGILFWIGKTQNVLLGAVVGATFAIGLGIPFWLVGTFAVNLPKAGKWMTWVKSFFGIVMLVVAFYMLKSPFPALASFAQRGDKFLMICAAAVAVGVLLGAIHLSWDDGDGMKQTIIRLRKGVGIVLAAGGGFLFWASLDMPKPFNWEHSEQAAIARAKAEKRPMVIDFTAEWCGACKELAKETFSDPRVQAKASDFVALKVDATDDEDPQVDAVKGKYGVVGLPTVVILDSTGAEKKRFNEFVGPDQFVAALNEVN